MNMVTIQTQYGDYLLRFSYEDFDEITYDVFKKGIYNDTFIGEFTTKYDIDYQYSYFVFDFECWCRDNDIV